MRKEANTSFQADPYRFAAEEKPRFGCLPATTSTDNDRAPPPANLRRTFSLVFAVERPETLNPAVEPSAKLFVDQKLPMTRQTNLNGLETRRPGERSDYAAMIGAFATARWTMAGASSHAYLVPHNDCATSVPYPGGRRSGRMLVFLLSCLFGAVCAVGLWMTFTAHTTIDEIVKRGGTPFPPGEP